MKATEMTGDILCKVEWSGMTTIMNVSLTEDGKVRSIHYPHSEEVTTYIPAEDYFDSCKIMEQRWREIQGEIEHDTRVKQIAERIAVERKEALDLLAPFDGPLE